MDYFKNPYVIYGASGPIAEVDWKCSGVKSDNTLTDHYYIHNGAGDGEKPYTPLIWYSEKNKEYSL
jgi:hypothetical protein